jgi:acyl-CoA reductase-like NAD-dependent aldehyde dehydrogenase
LKASKRIFGGEWEECSLSSSDERVAIVMEITENIRHNTESLANLLTLEIGKVPSESVGELVEIFEVAQSIEARAAECGGDHTHVTRQYNSKDSTRRVELVGKGTLSLTVALIVFDLLYLFHFRSL